MLLTTVLLACRPTDVPPDPTDSGTTPPDVLEVSMSVPETSVRQVRLLVVETDEPTTLELVIDDGRVVRHVAFPERATHHEVPVLGLPAGDEVWVDLTVIDDDGEHTEQALEPIVVGGLPARWPEVDVLAHDREAMEPGYRLFNLRSPDGILDWLVVLDRDLRLVWWREGPPNFGDVRRTERGTLVGLQGPISEIDLSGRELAQLDPGVRLHHEVYPRPDGGFWSLGYGDSVAVDDYPLSLTEPETVRGPALVRPDTLLELDEDGQVVSSRPLTELLDPSRIGFDSLSVIGPGPVYDWSHANGVIERPDGVVLVSSRHQGAVVAVEPTGEVRWILADPAGWSPAFEPLLLEPVGEVSWPYGQHAPEWTDDGLLVLFDNHNDGHTPYTSGPASQPPSRGVAYRIDEQAGTVELAWELTAPGLLFSAALGDADVLPVTGNVLLDYGFLAAEDDVLNTDMERGTRSIRLVEVHPDRPEDPVLNLSLWGPLAEEPDGYKAFRAELLPQLYPDDVTVTVLDDP